MKNTNAILKNSLMLLFLVQTLDVKAQPTTEYMRQLKENKELILVGLNKGYVFQIEKKDSLAIIEYKKVLLLDKANHTAYYNLSLIYAKSGRELKAIDIVNTALAYCTEDLSDFYLLKANCLSSLKKYDEALPIYHKALQLEPSDANLQYNLGYTYFMLKKWESALIYLEECIKSSNENERNYDDALFYIGTCYLSLKKYDNALKYFDSAIDKNPYYTYFSNKAEALLSLNREAEALQVINFAIDKYPDTAALYHKRYSVYNKMNKADLAIADLKKAYLLSPNDGKILLNMGVMYERENNIEKAIEIYQKCIDSKQNLADAYGNLANIYAKNKLTQEKALIYYQKAISEEPNDAYYYYNFGNYYRKLKQWSPAISLYERAIELNSDFAATYVNLAVIYRHQKQLEKAIEYISKAVEIAPEDFIANAQAASAFFEKENYNNAIKYATKALSLGPRENKDKQLLHIRGVSRQMLSDYKNAIYDYLEIVEKFSIQEKKANADVFSNIGYCYMEVDQLENALKYFKEAVEYDSEIDQLIGLFTVQYLLNDKVGFKKNLKKAKSVDKKLKKGYNGILQLEIDGYFYTEKHKSVLKTIFN